ncbi:MAG: hypothetical protein AB1757_11040 [Acidobacteriota bacterium]
MNRRWFGVAVLCLFISSNFFNSFAIEKFNSSKSSDHEWAAYGRDQGSSRFSPLTQINRENVKSLQVAQATPITYQINGK